MIGNENIEGVGEGVNTHIVSKSLSNQVVVIGQSCRFASAWNMVQLWELLIDGGDGVSTVSPSRWNWIELDESIPKWGCFFVGLEQFDGGFFNISPREAKGMDPQHRMLLECSWECIESSGNDPNSMKDLEYSVNVYVGIQGSEYSSLFTSAAAGSTTGSALSTAAGRISYILGIDGEAMSIDTACSSSLVAIHHGVKSITKGEAGTSLCFGVNAMIDKNVFPALFQAGMLSPDGRCKTFDNTANGYVRGEGCGSIMITRDDNNNNVLSKIVGHAVNQDGRSNGLTAPNGPSQVKLIKEATKNISNDYSYIEAHGTGTSLGDPIEMQAIEQAIGSNRNVPLVVGSAKTNFGHCETAAGILGILKVLLCMKNELIVPHLHLNVLNEYIGSGLMEGMKCSIPIESIEWKNNDRLISGVSSFGFSGTNAHVVMEKNMIINNNVVVGLSIVLSTKTNNSFDKLINEYCITLVEGRYNLVNNRDVSKWNISLSLSGKNEIELYSILERNDLLENGDLINNGECENVLVGPTYSFDRKRYWVDEANIAIVSEGSAIGNKILVDDNKFIYQIKCDALNAIYNTKDHIVYEYEIMPGASHLVLLLEQSQNNCINSIEIREPVIIKQEVMIQYIHEGKNGNGEMEVRTIESNNNEELVKIHVLGISNNKVNEMNTPRSSISNNDWINIESSLWDEMKGIVFGPSFRWMNKCSKIDNASVVVELKPPSTWKHRKGVLNVPVELLDSMFQTSLLLIGDGDEGLMAPFALNELYVSGIINTKSTMMCEGIAVSKTKQTSKFNMKVIEGRLAKIAVNGFVAAKASKEAFIQTSKDDDIKEMLYEIVWKKENIANNNSSKELESQCVVVGSIESIVESVSRLFKKQWLFK